MELRITRLPEETHRAAKMLAAHQGVSLNKFIADAILARCMQVAHAEGLTGAVLREVEKPQAKSKGRK